MRTIKDIKAERKAKEMAEDIETMMNVTNNDPGHIARAKAKAERIKNDLQKKADNEAKQRAKKAEQKARSVAEHIDVQLRGIIGVTFVISSMIGYIYAMMF